MRPNWRSCSEWCPVWVGFGFMIAVCEALGTVTVLIASETAILVVFLDQVGGAVRKPGAGQLFRPAPAFLSRPGAARGSGSRVAKRSFSDRAHPPGSLPPGARSEKDAEGALEPETRHHTMRGTTPPKPPKPSPSP